MHGWLEFGGLPSAIAASSATPWGLAWAGNPQKAKPCTGWGQETACAYCDGDRKVRLCPECLERMRRGPGARESGSFPCYSYPDQKQWPIPRPDARGE